MRTVLSCLFRNMSEPDKKIQKEMTNAAGMIKLSIYKEKVPIYCVFVTEISRNTYSLLTTWKCCPARSSWARTRLVYVTIMRCGNHFGIFTSGQLQSRPRCWILKSPELRDDDSDWLKMNLYFTYEFRDTRKSYTFFLAVKISRNWIWKTALN